MTLSRKLEDTESKGYTLYHLLTIMVEAKRLIYSIVNSGE